MSGNSRLSQHLLKTLFHYCPESGLFTRLLKTAKNTKVGDVAGSLNSYGYLVIRIDSRHYRAHRLAFLYMTGEFPPADIDHINGVKTDNRWSNLREATSQQNNQNAGKRSDNTSGFKGVSWHKKAGKWRTEIRVPILGRHHLGYFNTPEEAHAAYVGAAALFHGLFANTGAKQ